MPTIHALKTRHIPELEAHLQRHRHESGRADIHFMPYAPDSADGPRGLVHAAMDRPLDEPGWQRWFIARTEDETTVGHVDLKGDAMATGLHRCELGIGIERVFRGQGLGRRLMNTALEYARNSSNIAWVDLRVFAHNVAAQALYSSLGFTEIGTLSDRFRIDGQQIDDVIMTLNVE